MSLFRGQSKELGPQDPSRTASQTTTTQTKLPVGQRTPAGLPALQFDVNSPRNVQKSDVRRQRVLVVEDEQILALDLEVRLEAMSYAVTLAASGEGAAAAIERLKPDIILRNIRLNDSIDGIEVASLIRKDTDASLISLTAYSDHQTLERAAKVDPSNYIVKPFNERELVATVCLVLRGRQNPHRPPTGDTLPQEYRDFAVPTICIGNVKIDLVRHRVFVRDTEIQLTKKEFGILQFLAERAGEAVSSKAILTRVWGTQFTHYIQTLRVHIRNLRQKIETHSPSGVLIKLVRGIGYRLIEDPRFDSVELIADDYASPTES